MKRLRNTYDKKLDKIDKLKQELDDVRIAMQLECKHERIAEVPYKSDPYGHNHIRPYMVCEDCGFAEGGWSCGYQILTGRPLEANADTPSKRIGRVWENHIFVVPVTWRQSGMSPQNKEEAYEMAVRNNFPEEYLEHKID